MQADRKVDALVLLEKGRWIKRGDRIMLIVNPANVCYQNHFTRLLTKTNVHARSLQTTDGPCDFLLAPGGLHDTKMVSEIYLKCSWLAVKGSPSTKSFTILPQQQRNVSPTFNQIQSLTILIMSKGFIKWPLSLPSLPSPNLPAYKIKRAAGLSTLSLASHSKHKVIQSQSKHISSVHKHQIPLN